MRARAHVSQAGCRGKRSMPTSNAITYRSEGHLLRSRCCRRWPWTKPRRWAPPEQSAMHVTTCERAKRESNGGGRGRCVQHQGDVWDIRHACAPGCGSTCRPQGAPIPSATGEGSARSVTACYIPHRCQTAVGRARAGKGRDQAGQSEQHGLSWVGGG